MFNDGALVRPTRQKNTQGKSWGVSPTNEGLFARVVQRRRKRTGEMFVRVKFENGEEVEYASQYLEEIPEVPEEVINSRKSNSLLLWLGN